MILRGPKVGNGLRASTAARTVTLVLHGVNDWPLAIVILLGFAATIVAFHETALFADALSLIFRHVRKEVDANTTSILTLTNEVRLLRDSVKGLFLAVLAAWKP